MNPNVVLDSRMKFNWDELFVALFAEEEFKNEIG